MYSQLLWYLLQLIGVDLGVDACRLIDAVWTKWVDECWEHALDQPTHVFKESESSEWGSNHLCVRSTLTTVCQCAAFKPKELN